MKSRNLKEKYVEVPSSIGYGGTFVVAHYPGRYRDGGYAASVPTTGETDG